MGHKRLGRLGKSQRWRYVVALLEESPDNQPLIAQATLKAAETHLRALARDEAVSYCFWLLTRITSAARQGDFSGAMSDLGIDATNRTSAVAFLSAISDLTTRQARDDGHAGPFAQIAALSLRRALTEALSDQRPSFFDSSVDDLQQSLRRQSTQAQFGRVSQRFFGDFLARSLAYFVDREVSNSVGPRTSLRDVAAAKALLDGIDLHARQTALIVREFAGGWYSKHQWESRGQISREETDRFVAYAFQKLRSELSYEATRT